MTIFWHSVLGAANVWELDYDQEVFGVADGGVDVI